jgi:hypothetical protein
VWFNVGEWCGTSGRCRWEGEAARCYAGGCDIAGPGRLRVDISGFASELIGRQDLNLTLIGGLTTTSPDIVEVNLDGFIGRRVRGASSNETTIVWGPFPSDPMALELHFPLQTPPGGLVFLNFQNLQCNLENPEPDCDL